MKLTHTQGLVLLNAALLAGIAAVTFGPQAIAQNDRRRAQYVITAGTVKGTEVAAIWIIDETNQDLIALAWNSQQGQLDGLGYRDLVADAGTLVGRGRN
jgi:hypothetical protein